MRKTHSKRVGVRNQRRNIMDMGLKGKTAVITASSLGLGKAMAQGLAQEGANVTICARRNNPLETAKNEIEKVGGQVLSIKADMNSKDDIEKVISETVSRFGKLDILINNAGDAEVGRKIEDEDDVWQATYNINVWSCVRAIRAAVPHMRKNGGGNIINVASVSGHSGLAGMADYNSAKAAMLSLTKTFAADLAPDNIRVNAVNPALIHTPLWERLAKENFVGSVGDSVDEVFENLSKQMLLIPRYGKPEEVANVTTFLASERASFVTGACWNVDGGFTKFII